MHTKIFNNTHPQDEAIEFAIGAISGKQRSIFMVARLRADQDNPLFSFDQHYKIFIFGNIHRKVVPSARNTLFPSFQCLISTVEARFNLQYIPNEVIKSLLQFSKS